MSTATAPEPTASPTEHQVMADSISSFMSGLPKEVAASDPPPVGLPPDAQPPVAAPPAAPARSGAAKAAADKAAASEPPEKDEDGDPWPRKAQDWKAIKTKHKEQTSELTKKVSEYEAKVKDYETKLAAAAGASPEAEKRWTEKLAEKEKELAEYQNRLRQIAVERDPRFEQHFNDLTQQQIAAAVRVVGAQNGEQVKQLLAMPEGAERDAALQDFADTLPMLKQGQLGGVLANLAAIQQERDTQIANARSNYEKIQRDNQETAKAAQTKRQQQVEQMFNDAVKQAQDPANGNPAFQMRQGDDAWNKGVDERVQFARNLLTGQLDPSIVTKAAFYAASTPAILKLYVDAGKASAEKITALEAQIKELTAAQPGMAGGARTTQPGGASKPISSNTSPRDAMKSFTDSIASGMRELTSR